MFLSPLYKDDARLRKLCQKGLLESVKEFVSQMPNEGTLESLLSNRKGPLGYTPLHEATVSGHHAILDFLLQEDWDKHVNCRANKGYTPLHLAASAGWAECVRVLLKHNADVHATDECGMSPRQAAELSSKRNVVRILCSAGESGTELWVCVRVSSLGGVAQVQDTESHHRYNTGIPYG